ncbi:MAG: ExbD/TolR family protein [Elusimicrobiota bacterium]
MAGTQAEEDDIVAGINVTPLVDVCLVLVIIFMVTAPLMSNPPLKVDLPKAHGKKGDEGDKITITLAKDGRAALDYQEYPNSQALENDLKMKLAQSSSKLVVLRADKDALEGRLTDLMARAKDAGALSLTIETEREK